MNLGEILLAGREERMTFTIRAIDYIFEGITTPARPLKTESYWNPEETIDPFLDVIPFFGRPDTLRSLFLTGKLDNLAITAKGIPLLSEDDAQAKAKPANINDEYDTEAVVSKEGDVKVTITGKEGHTYVYTKREWQGRSLYTLTHSIGDATKAIYGLETRKDNSVVLYRNEYGVKNPYAFHTVRNLDAKGEKFAVIKVGQFFELAKPRIGREGSRRHARKYQMTIINPKHTNS